MQATVIPEVKEAEVAIKKLYGNRLDKIILFGSYARGEQTSESDIDLLIVLKDAEIASGKEIRYINDSLFNLALQSGKSISAFPVSAKRFATEASFFFNRVKKEGKEL